MVADLPRIKPLRRLLQTGLVLLVLIAGVSIYSGIALRNQTLELNERTETVRTLNRLMSALQNIETGQRGYVITGYEDYLQPYHEGRTELLLLLDQLPSKLGNDPATVDRLQQLAEARLKNIEQIIRSRRNEGFAAAQAEIMTRRGKLLMDRLRDEISPRIAQLRTQIDRDLISQSQTEWLLLISITVFIVLLLLMVPAALYVWRQQLQKESLEQQRLKLTRELLTAQVDERKRISQLLHDDVAQVMAAAKLTLEAECARQQQGQPIQLERINSTVTILERALVETRSLLGELRPPLLSELGLQAALNYEVDRMRSRAGTTTLAVMWQERGAPPRFDGGTEHSVFLLVREAMHNALRHADAKHIRIDADSDDSRLRIAVQDDGTGFNVEDLRQQEGHFGVIGMRERAASIGADIDISSRIGRGTVITLVLPHKA